MFKRNIGVNILSKLFEQQVGGTHYSDMKIQPMEFFEANNIPANEAIAIRYILRHRNKNGAQDLDKAIDMLQKIKLLVYGE